MRALRVRCLQTEHQKLSFGYPSFTHAAKIELIICFFICYIFPSEDTWHSSFHNIRFSSPCHHYAGTNPHLITFDIFIHICSVHLQPSHNKTSSDIGTSNDKGRYVHGFLARYCIKYNEPDFYQATFHILRNIYTFYRTFSASSDGCFVLTLFRLLYLELSKILRSYSFQSSGPFNSISYTSAFKISE